MSAMAFQITSLAIVYTSVYSGADQTKHQSSASLAFVKGIHRWPVNSPHKWPVMRKMFSFHDVIIICQCMDCFHTKLPIILLIPPNFSVRIWIVLSKYQYLAMHTFRWQKSELRFQFILLTANICARLHMPHTHSIYSHQHKNTLIKLQNSCVSSTR